jgi:nicotinate phosphoribosyltransferase
MINHYKKLKIDPMTKTIVFSDNLNLEKVKEIHVFCQGKIKYSFGIGTFFSNDFENSPALNMVIKLYSINDEPCVKLSDNPGKECGDKEAVKIYKKIYGVV